MLSVGLLGMGGSDWIAGVQYLHSLLYGNTLLPQDEQSALRVYLDRHYHRTSDYRAVIPFTRGLQVTEFDTSPVPLYRTVGRIAQTFVQEAPASPDRQRPVCRSYR